MEKDVLIRNGAQPAASWSATNCRPAPATPSDAAALWQHAAEDRDAAAAGRIRSPQNAAEFGDRIGRKRDMCQRIGSEEHQRFRIEHENSGSGK